MKTMLIGKQWFVLVTTVLVLIVMTLSPDPVLAATNVDYNSSATFGDALTDFWNNQFTFTGVPGSVIDITVEGTCTPDVMNVRAQLSDPTGGFLGFMGGNNGGCGANDEFFTNVNVDSAGTYTLTVYEDGARGVVTVTITCVSGCPVADNDNDTYNSPADCNDSNAAINPGAAEIANNGIDEDCSGADLVIDVDNDTYNSAVDCNDNNAAINPGAAEIAGNGIDENCDGTDAAVPDSDNDGYNDNLDCDDTNGAINPGAAEIANNGIDEDCSGADLVIDVDNDTYNSTADCNDNNAGINPGAAEIANNGIDEDCSGTDLVIDVDNDTYNSAVDCNDNNAAINPGAAEIAGNGIDENCDGTDAVVPDSDSDGYNDILDCDDANAAINPGATEIAGNGIDENCDGNDAVVPDSDSDGYNDILDCDDANAAINPGATEIAGNGIDENCDGSDSSVGIPPVNGGTNPVVSFPPPPPLAPCRQNGADADVRILSTTSGAYCRPITSMAQIGILELIQAGVLNAVDVYGHGSAEPLAVCLRGQGGVAFLDARNSPRTAAWVPSTSTADGFTCVTIPADGLVVLVGGASAQTPAQAIVEPGVVIDLSGKVCEVMTTYAVRIRAEASAESAQLDTLPFQITLRATAYNTSGWYRVIYQDFQGWVSAAYLETVGDCA